MPTLRELPRDAGFVEVADRVWVARHAWFDVNVSVVGGSRGLLVVDTHASDKAARTVLDALRRQVPGDVVAVVNTHEHFDHAYGNGVFRAAYPGVPLIAHEEAAARLAAVAADPPPPEPDDDPRVADVYATDVVPPDTTFASVRVVDLGDRAVELVHPGRGHTGGDVVARVDDADVLFAGDLVEESRDRDGVPGYGPDCHPMEWPLTLDLVLDLLGPSTLVVPGHGNPVDLDFVTEQRGAIGVVAETIRDLAGRGVPLAEALDAAEWPFPRRRARRGRTTGLRGAASRGPAAAARLGGRAGRQRRLADRSTNQAISMPSSSHGAWSTTTSRITRNGSGPRGPSGPRRRGAHAGRRYDGPASAARRATTSGATTLPCGSGRSRNRGGSSRFVRAAQARSTRSSYSALSRRPVA